MVEGQCANDRNVLGNYTDIDTRVFSLSLLSTLPSLYLCHLFLGAEAIPTAWLAVVAWLNSLESLIGLWLVWSCDHTAWDTYSLRARGKV